jgi:hypothetical protein
VGSITSRASLGRPAQQLGGSSRATSEPVATVPSPAGLRCGGQMSQNDVIHLEANFADWQKNRGAGLTGIDPFLYYSLDQLLKPFNLADDEIKYGIIDQGNDGGIDAIYLFANRNTLIRDDIDLKAAGTSRIHIVAVQVKSSLSKTGFEMGDIRKFQSFSDDLYDLATPAIKYKHKYHDDLITVINTFRTNTWR